MLSKYVKMKSTSSGFYTKRMCDYCGKIKAYALASPIDYFADGLFEDNANCFLTFTRSGVISNYELFDTLGVELLSCTYGMKYFLLDEIGGPELLNEKFAMKLNEIISGAFPCVGVLKSVEGARQTAERITFGTTYLEAYDRFREMLFSRNDTLVIHFNNDKNTCENAISSFFKSFA